jgi:hypothetical protein
VVVVVVVVEASDKHLSHINLRQGNAVGGASSAGTCISGTFASRSGSCCQPPCRERGGVRERDMLVFTDVPAKQQLFERLSQAQKKTKR